VVIKREREGGEKSQSYCEIITGENQRQPGITRKMYGEYGDAKAKFVRWQERDIPAELWKKWGKIAPAATKRRREVTINLVENLTFPYG